MAARFLHWSKEPVRLEPRSYTQAIAYKPRGLWFDVDGDWRRWCEGESFNLDGFAYCYDVTLHEPKRLHWMRSVNALDAFTRRFLARMYPEQELRARSAGIDWRRVAEEYEGIVIAPYQWERRLELMWYYTFDCASGCIWNPAIVSLKTAGRVPSPPGSPDVHPLGRKP